MSAETAEKYPERDQSLMNIGKNCSECHALDFLPYTCEYCHRVFCADHRKLDAHKCPGKTEFNSGKARSPSPTGPSASSLFPDREKDRKRIDELIKTAKPLATTILDKQFRVGDVAAKTPNAFSKLAKFLSIQKSKKPSSVGKLFSKQLLAAAQLHTLKKDAKGDVKVAAAERAHLWVVYVDSSSAKTESEETDVLSQIQVEKDRKPVYVSQNWSVGRALDSVADTLRIKNYNNHTLDLKERLNIFKVDAESPVLLKNSDRVKGALKNGDTIYLVKGSL